MIANPLSFHWRSLARRLFGLLLLPIAVGAAQAKAVEHKAVARTHPRLRAVAHAFIKVSLPEVGLLPDADSDLPDAGQTYELRLALARTGEVIDVVYRIGNTYIPEALNELNDFLRDSHNQEVTDYDPREFDLLHTVLARVGKANGIVDVLSGFRSQETNDELRESGTTNAAEHSQHILGKAMDIRVVGVSAAMLRNAALSLAAGGVGYYPASQFVHLDVGPQRQWTFSPHAHRRRVHRR